VTFKYGSYAIRIPHVPSNKIVTHLIMQGSEFLDDRTTNYVEFYRRHISSIHLESAVIQESISVRYRRKVRGSGRFNQDPMGEMDYHRGYRKAKTQNILVIRYAIIGSNPCGPTRTMKISDVSL
jgi:hypothetical protein